MNNTLIQDIKRMSIACAVVAIVILTRCTTEFSGGGGSEAGNARVAGIIFDEQGAPAAHVVVQLHPSDYDPIHDIFGNNSSVDTTTSDGRFTFTVEDSTLRYSVQAAQIDSRLVAFIAGVKAVTSDNDTPVNCSLQTPGTIRVLRPKNSTADSGYLYIPGTTLYTRVNPAGGYTLLSMVPAGALPSINYTSIDGTIRSVVQTNVAVTAGDTMTIAMEGWAYSRSIILNTSATGADVAGTVYQFPVLVRLSSPAFNFYQSQSNGRDLRFVSPSGTTLSHEIELWDTTAKKAAVWVKVDTLYGNNSTQSITMYWGNPDASDVSTSSAVFDTTNGFQGVWHLSETADTPVRDATINGYHGTSPDTARPQVTEGVIGKCRLFNGVADYITMPNTADSKLDFQQNGTYSVSVWVMADTLVDLQQTLVSKGRYQYFLWIDSTFWQFWEYQDRIGWEASEQQATSRQWVLLCGVRDGAAQYLYVNGERVDSVSLKSDFNLRTTASDLILGRVNEFGVIPATEEVLCNFKGKIDEVRISSVAQSPDWVRLCYINQSIDDRLVIFK